MGRIFAVGTVANLVLFGTGYLAGWSGASKQLSIGFLCLAVLSCAPALLFILYYLGTLNYSWYYEFRSRPWVDLLPSAVGFTIGYAAATLSQTPDLVPVPGQSWISADSPPHLLIIAGVSFSALVFLAVHAKPMLFPLDLDELDDKWSEAVCIQTSPFTCGPCAAATVLHNYGHDVTETELARRAFTSRRGTLNWYLARVLRKDGFCVSFDTSLELSEVPTPAIIGVFRLPRRMPHFVALLQNGEIVHVGDPSVGRLVLTPREFNNRYEFAHFCMMIRP